ncbi:MAG: imidazoleglycerol-phosphate dehydratase HisB [Clostridiaceae bacterium]|jgi:imidazoleglycerol-phosphate dehydratase|nr:imidazoleglycerol-phosphate dehydratase HisB [Clostridiaceae bacterium]
MKRSAEVTRKTGETDIQVKLVLDGTGTAQVDSGIGFFDHMLILLAKHALLDLQVSCRGDLQVDSHHSIEDIGIVLGQAISAALGGKESIQRYGTAFVPMDEALAMASMDLSSRPFLWFDVPFSTPLLGDMETEMVEEFFRAVAVHGGITLHLQLMHGKNNHHIAEAVFKAFGQALRQASAIDNRISGVLSTKGIL